MNDKFIEFDERFESPAELTDNELYKEVHDLRARIANLETENEDLKVLIHDIIDAAESEEDLADIIEEVKKRFDESLFDEPY